MTWSGFTSDLLIGSRNKIGSALLPSLAIHVPSSELLYIFWHFGLLYDIGWDVILAERELLALQFDKDSFVIHDSFIC